jgi:splicing factor 3B subunit 3
MNKIVEENTNVAKRPSFVLFVFSMYLYNLTLQKASSIVQCAYGNFSGPKAQEIVVGRGKILELLRPDENGKMQSILSVEIFGVVRSIVPFRLTGKNQ